MPFNQADLSRYDITQELSLKGSCRPRVHGPEAATNCDLAADKGRRSSGDSS